MIDAMLMGIHQFDFYPPLHTIIQTYRTTFGKTHFFSSKDLKTNPNNKILTSILTINVVVLRNNNKVEV